MKRIFTFLSLLFFSSVIAQTTHEEAKRAIEERSFPNWFQDAKLGIFIHWGLYSVPAYGGKESYSEWYLRGLQMNDSLRTNFLKKTYGSDFTYNDLTNEFKAELFDPEEWADLFKRAGAKYVVLVSKHHDGYALWPSKYNRNWNSVDTGPKRDIVGEVTEAVRDSGLKMGLYYSLPEWNHPLHRWYSDPHDSINTYVETYMIPQFKELVSTYKPSLIFADGEWYNSAKQWHSAELINWYYNLVGDEAIVNNRWGSGLDVGFLTPEYSAGIKETSRPWAEVRGIGRSFGLNRNEDLEAYGTSKELVEKFVQAVANGGGMILNVGPGADGQIPLIQQERLVQLGNWLEINGEAIYGAEAFEITEEEKEVQISRVDEVINFNWVRNSPLKGIREDDFSVRWESYLVAPKNGKYNIELDADDEAILELDERTIINNNYTAPDKEAEVMNANTSYSENAVVDLKAGKPYKLVLNYREKKQNAKVTISWSSKGGEKEIIPGDAFYLDQEKTQPGLQGKYTSLKTHIAYTKKNNSLYAISFEWPEDSLQLNIPKPKPGATVKMLGLERELDWSYKNSKMFINTSGIKYNELPSHDAWTFKIDNY
jgi:alpha-L-fucosidase